MSEKATIREPYVLVPRCLVVTRVQAGLPHSAGAELGVVVFTHKKGLFSPYGNMMVIEHSSGLDIEVVEDVTSS